jgi:hypothetical protein
VQDFAYRPVRIGDRFRQRLGGSAGRMKSLSEIDLSRLPTENPDRREEEELSQKI